MVHLSSLTQYFHLEEPDSGASKNGAGNLVDEPERLPHEAVKPKTYYAYDRYADKYLPMPT